MLARYSLNMLLSFAQFEREVAGERIRDKFAATKKQGYWVCGQPPLGYRLQRGDEPRGLYILTEEAQLVREMFSRFSESRSLVGVAELLNSEGHTTKRWTSSTGRVHGGKPLTQKYIHGLLTNPVYIGMIRHRRGDTQEVYKGRHEPIVHQELWDAVQAAINSPNRDRIHRWVHPHLLKGKLRTHDGYAMSPTSTQRPVAGRDSTSRRRDRRLVHYYISQRALKHGFRSCPIKSVNAKHLDDLVRATVLDHVANRHLDGASRETVDHHLRVIILQVRLAELWLQIDLDTAALDSLRLRRFETLAGDSSERPCGTQRPQAERLDSITRLTLDIAIKKSDRDRRIVGADGRDLVMPSRPEPVPHLINAIGLAYRWHDDMLATGRSMAAVAREAGVEETRIRRLLPLTRLGPETLRDVLFGTLPPRVTLTDLLRAAKDPDWAVQRRHLGLSDAP